MNMFLTDVVVTSSLLPEFLFPEIFISVVTVILFISYFLYLKKRNNEKNKNETSKQANENEFIQDLKKSVDKASNPDSNKKYCDYCGTEMEDNAKKCSSCGAKRSKK